MVQRKVLKCKNCFHEYLVDFIFEEEEGNTIQAISIGCPECHKEFELDFLPIQDFIFRKAIRAI